MKNIKNVFFLGIGGIGMSALARFFKHNNLNVVGYDKTPTELTSALISEGIKIHFEEDIALIPNEFIQNSAQTLVILTPAIPQNHSQLNFFKKHNFQILKRAQVLGKISKNYPTIAVAGTHGKTSISTLTAHILEHSKVPTIAFLGGISKNYNSNLILPQDADIPQFMVAEADEFDRSFLHLHPKFSLISSTDPDHLDIYENHQNILDAFSQFATQNSPDGRLVLKYGLPLSEKFPAPHFTYHLENSTADFYAKQIVIKNNRYHVDFQTPFGLISDVEIPLPGLVNVENALAATALVLSANLQFSHQALKSAIADFQGVKRRFDLHFNYKNELLYIDDYAHHPAELAYTIKSVKEFYPKHRICGIFQPHLFTRTRDFANGFAESLAMLDELILLPIYPARELPIPNVSSEMIFNLLPEEKKKTSKILPKKAVVSHITEMLERVSEPTIFLTLGAGNIDTLVPEIANSMKKLRQ